MHYCQQVIDFRYTKRPFSTTLAQLNLIWKLLLSRRILILRAGANVDHVVYRKQPDSIHKFANYWHQNYVPIVEALHSFRHLSKKICFRLLLVEE